MSYHTPVLRASLADLVAEYDGKLAAIPSQIEAFEAAVREMERACSMGGTFGGGLFRHAPQVSQREAALVLLKSAWRHVYDGLQIAKIAPAGDKRRIDALLESPPVFSLPAIREHFGDYVADPRGNILRGLAETFASLDPAYRSHARVKVGVKGLPKRIIISGVSSYGGWGRDRLENVLNALAAYQGKPLVTYPEINALMKDEDALATERGVRLRRFANGNGHVFFEPHTLADINRALAEFYGDVLPDVDDKPAKPCASTAVSKDLQYYPTPRAVVERVLAEVHVRPGGRVLEPSCGCGRFLDALRDFDRLGIEVDAGRAAEARAKGHPVLCANFLEHPASPEFDAVVMNPPFYGRHYLKHVAHALRFLKPGGRLVSILPGSAWYDHAEVQNLGWTRWHDLPTASFAESGTNIPTGFVIMETVK